MKKVSDIVAEFLASENEVSNHIFMVSGGGNMHLIDSLGRNPHLEYICNHHEQACTFAAEGYARVTNKIGVSYVTTGPGGTNAITGVYSAWVDSIPTLTISGQVKFETTIASQPELQLRQLGDQEVNIIDLVTPITKYAVMITDKNLIKYHLQKAVYEAKSGRPGPVWLDIPLDIQGAYVNEEELVAFTPEQEPLYDTKIDEVVALLQKAKRPVIIAGNGLRLASALPEFHEFIEKSNIPVLTAISGIDVIESDHELFFGRPGILGERAANFIIQNCDLLLIFGTRMNIRIISYRWETFAREAKIIMVDIDKNELRKKTLRPDIGIQADLKQFLFQLNKNIVSLPKYDEWLHYCIHVQKDFPIPDKSLILNNTFVSSYSFALLLSQILPNETCIVTGNGTAYTSTFQAYRVRKNDRVFANVGCAAMGYDLPAAIGACFARNKKEVICITGDGSIQMNLQELQTIIHHQLPIKIFMYNNSGYLSIRLTQKNFFSENLVGEGSHSGVTIPNMQNLAKAYGFKVFHIKSNQEAQKALPKILQEKGPVFCELLLDPEEQLGPKVASYTQKDGKITSKPLEDLAPFLPQDQFLKYMIIPPVDDV
jgi:acetolactate synthase-1/2/3 large subunit